MGAPVLVRSSLRTWDVTLLVAAGVAFAAGAAFAGLHTLWMVAVGLTVAALAFLLGGLFAWRRRIRLRRWVQDTGDGFLVRDRVGERTVKDREVVSLALALKRNFLNGSLRSVTRRCRLWLATAGDRPERLELTNTIATGGQDPLAGLLCRLGDRLFEQAQQDRRDGLPILGEGWRIEGPELILTKGGTQDSVPLADVTAVDTVDEHVCVWRRGRDEAFLRLPADAANAYLLGRFLAEHLDAQPPAHSPTPEDRLGRLLFERRPNKAPAVVLAVMSAVFGLLSLLGLFGGPVKVTGLPWGLLAFAITGAGSGFYFYCLCRQSCFRCHEYGVSQAGWWGQRTLRYEDMDALTYEATALYHNGVYGGTHLRLTFESAAEPTVQRIRFGGAVQGMDEELVRMRDVVSGIIARRMAQQLAAGRPVGWTKRLRFLPTGLECRPGRFGKGEPIVVPYEVVRCQVEQFGFCVYGAEPKKPLTQGMFFERNVFPGLVLLQTLCEGGTVAEPLPS